MPVLYGYWTQTLTLRRGSQEAWSSSLKRGKGRLRLPRPSLVPWHPRHSGSKDSGALNARRYFKGPRASASHCGVAKEGPLRGLGATISECGQQKWSSKLSMHAHLGNPLSCRPDISGIALRQTQDPNVDAIPSLLVPKPPKPTGEDFGLADFNHVRRL